MIHNFNSFGLKPELYFYREENNKTNQEAEINPESDF